jgi:hypothetical protein
VRVSEEAPRTSMEEERQTGELQLGFKIFIGSKFYLNVRRSFIGSPISNGIIQEVDQCSREMKSKDGNKIFEIDQVENCSLSPNDEET